MVLTINLPGVNVAKNVLKLQPKSKMMPVETDKNKEDLNTPADQSHIISTCGVKRSGEEGDNEDVTTVKKEKADGDDVRLENAEEENLQIQEEADKEMIEAPEESETCFMDLVDDALINIFTFLDLPSRLNLRVNKRLDRLHFSVKNNLKKINLIVDLTQSQLIMDNCTRKRSSNFTEWGEGLRRSAQNVFVREIYISLRTTPNEQHSRIIDALFHLKSDRLSMHKSGRTLIDLSHLTLPSFLTLAQNTRSAHFYVTFSSLSSQDLCTIRQTILKGGYMKTFGTTLRGGTYMAFLKECFGIIIEEVYFPVRGKIYRSADESLEVYRERGTVRGWKLTHFEVDLRTTLYTDNINFELLDFKKVEVITKPDDKFKIKWNHLCADVRAKTADMEKDMRLESAEEEHQPKHENAERKLMETQEELTDSSHSGTSFMDLVDDAHRNIISFLDLPSRLNLRVNKILDRLHFSVKNKFRRLRLSIGITQSKLIIDKHTLVRSSNFSEWEEGLCRIAQNAFADWISISVETIPNEEHFRLIGTLFRFKSDRLCMMGETDLAQLPVSSLLTLAQNTREVYMLITSTSMTARDFCAIRKLMIDGVSMESFYMRLVDRVGIGFMKECFGVTIEEVSEPVPGTIYHCGDESLELYHGSGRMLNHFEGDLKTHICGSKIIFKKLKVVEKPDDELKVELNELIVYENEEESDDEEENEEEEEEEEEN